ncbi:hypothetical protein [Flammeovirga sp. OC4]|uniref:hypothetical protein n=1 Tax=Flammeovirga sp. OC4 TaxID=1382345 RepID=UPI0005C748D2|nr:hypothetical protein [Flammeovirga sp. OC4]
MLTQSVDAQTKNNYIYTSLFKNDSLIYNRYISDHSFEIDNVAYFYSFNFLGDTLDTLITYEDENGKASLEIEIYDEYTDTTKYFYNEKNKIIKEINYNGEEKEYETISYSYDQNDRLIKKLHTYEFGRTKDSLIYDDSLLIQKLEYSATQFTLSERTDYFYNKKGLLVKSESWDNKNRRVGLRINTYNRKGLLKKSLYKNWYYSNIVDDTRGTLRLKYNKANKVSKSISKSEGSNVLTYVFYGKTNNVSKRIIIDKNSGFKTIKEYEGSIWR